MTTSTITARKKGDPQHYVERKMYTVLIMFESGLISRPLPGPPPPTQNLTVRAPPRGNNLFNCFPPKHSNKVSSSHFGVALAYSWMDKSYVRIKKLIFFETFKYLNEKIIFSKQISNCLGKLISTNEKNRFSKQTTHFLENIHIFERKIVLSKQIINFLGKTISSEERKTALASLYYILIYIYIYICI